MINHRYYDNNNNNNNNNNNDNDDTTSTATATTASTTTTAVTTDNNNNNNDDDKFNNHNNDNDNNYIFRDDEPKFYQNNFNTTQLDQQHSLIQNCPPCVCIIPGKVRIGDLQRFRYKKINFSDNLKIQNKFVRSHSNNPPLTFLRS